MTTRRAVLAAALAAPMIVPLAAYAAPAPLVRTSYGAMRGRRENGLYVFKGVRYGADTASRRFEPPIAPSPWQGEAKAYAYGPASPQAGDEPNQSEDCLFLNVWTPGLADGAKRPVMLYIHGGAYNNGSGSSPLYDGARLAAASDVVVITVNHRLNAFGYLYLPLLFHGAALDSGNAGQRDLVLALQWVARNAEAFGGDPGRVMVFGQSGGGAKIASLMAAPAGADLFHAAATMSGQQVTASGPLHATERARGYLAALKIDPASPGALARLLALPAQALVDALATRDAVDPTKGAVYFGPVLDGRHLKRHPFWPDAPAQSAKIPMILGNTHDETRGLIGRSEPETFALSWSDLPAYIARHARADLLPDEIVATYRAAYPTMSPADVFFAATTAGRSWRGQVEEADARARQGAPTWVYRFDLASPLDGGKWGAPHTIDIPHVFRTLDATGSITGTGPDAQRVSEEISRAFVALARSGDPNGPGSARWDQYRVPERKTLVFGPSTTLQADPRRIERELFAKVPFVQWGT